MPTPKKTRQQLAEEAYENQAQSLEQAGQNAADALTSAGQQYAADLNAANQARQDAYNAAQQAYQQRMNEGYTQFADIIAGERRRADLAEQEALAQRAAEQRAARWTGAGELAASVANMIAVGGFNASNQQYKSYSQDWMKQADENWRLNRARIDNMRDRQRALQQQLVQMRMGDAGQALNMATRQADAGYQHGTTAAQTRYQTSSAPVNIQMQAARDAGSDRTQGAMAGINAALQDEHVKQGWARINAEQDKTKTTMLTAGFVPDSSVPGGYRYDPKKAETIIGRIANPKSSKDSLEIPLMANGNLPAETITVQDDDALKTTILANIDAVTDLTDKQKNEVAELMEDNSIDAEKKARSLQRYLVSSGQLRALFRRSGAVGQEGDPEQGWLFRQYQPGN